MNPDQLLKEIQQSTDYKINKIELKEKILADLHMTYNGGMFLLDPAIMAFVATWPTSELFLEDVFENPISIQRDEFLTQAREHYHSVMNSWHIQHEEIKRVRKI